MRKIVYILLIISWVFLCNIGFYFYSDTYSSFLKKLKHKDEFSGLITDEYFLKNFDEEIQSCNCETVCNDNIQIQDKNDKFNIEELPNEVIPEKKVEDPLHTEIQTREQRENQQKISRILQKFSEYNLQEKVYDEYYEIFDITNEYPNRYVTYLSNDLEIYFFQSSNFEEFYNIFELLSKDMMVKDFELNRLDNFLRKSFFINIKPSDDKVRLVVDDGNIVFWIRVQKKNYDDIKKILQNF